MDKKRYFVWLVEFLCLVAITVILSTPRFSKYLMLFPVVIIVCAKVYDYRTTLNERELRVKAQLKLLVRLLSLEDVSQFRCTYHIPVWWGKFRQAFDYIPEGGGGGRTFATNKGIIGKALGAKRLLVENFATDAEFRQKMLLEYNYSADELRERKADRKSYLAYPLVDEEHRVHGVVYLDSSRPNTFTDAEDARTMRLIAETCETVRDSVL